MSSYLYFDVDSSGCWTNDDCEQSLPLLLSEGEKATISTGNCFEVKDIFWESGGGDVMNYWATLSFEEETLVVSCQGQAGQLCTAEPSFHHAFSTGGTQKCGFTMMVAFNGAVAPPTSSSTTSSTTTSSTNSSTTSSTSSGVTSSGTSSSATATAPTGNDPTEESTDTNDVSLSVKSQGIPNLNTPTDLYRSWSALVIDSLGRLALVKVYQS